MMSWLSSEIGVDVFDVVAGVAVVVAVDDAVEKRVRIDVLEERVEIRPVEIPAEANPEEE